MKRIRLFTAAAALLLAGGLSAAATVPAGAATRVLAASTARIKVVPVKAASTFFELNNRHTNGCIGIAAGQIYAASWNCTGHADQNMALEPGPNRGYPVC